MTGREPHLCHAEGCATRCPRRMLMCPPHWRMVPLGRQRAVLRTYRSGQERRWVMPSRAWLDAAHRAINSVARAEGRPLPYPGVEDDPEQAP